MLVCIDPPTHIFHVESGRKHTTTKFTSSRGYYRTLTTNEIINFHFPRSFTTEHTIRCVGNLSNLFSFLLFFYTTIIFDFANLSRLLDFLETINGVSGVDGSSTWLSPKIISFFLLFFGAVSPRTHYKSSQTISFNCSRLSDSTLFFCFLVDEIIFFVVFLENSF